MNIVTIDFDIIMQPSINLYNELTDKGWNELLSHPEMQLLRANMESYRKLSNYIFKCFSNMHYENIFFIEDHSQTISLITEPCNLINIDHHHDTGYESKSIKTVLSNNIDDGNWVSWLYQQKLIQKYIWIKNNNSEEELFNKNIESSNIIEFQKYNLNSLIIPDKLIICFSIPWVPPQY